MGKSRSECVPGVGSKNGHDIRNKWVLKYRFVIFQNQNQFSRSFCTPPPPRAAVNYNVHVCLRALPKVGSLCPILVVKGNEIGEFEMRRDVVNFVRSGWI